MDAPVAALRTEQLRRQDERVTTVTALSPRLRVGCACGIATGAFGMVRPGYRRTPQEVA